MAFLDTTVVNVALPAIGDDLGTDLAGFQWILDGYLLTLGSFVLIGGALGDRLGQRRVFELGVVAFGVASAACGFAPGTIALIVARVVQGMGAALLVPTSLALVQESFRTEDRGQAIGLWSGFSGLSTILGPVLGGWLIDAVSWRAIFLINPFLAAITILVARRFVPERKPGAEGSIDLSGALAAVLGLGGIVFALIEGPARGWGSLPVIAAATIGAVMLGAFFWFESRSDRAMLPLWCFRSKAFTGANATTLFVYSALGGVFFLLTIQLQRIVGYSPFEAGLATTPMTLLLLVLSPLAGRMYDRIGPRVPMTVGPLIGGAGVALLGRIGPESGYITGVLPGILVFGTGLGLTVAPLTSTALAALPDRHSGIAAGVNNAIARIAQLLGVTLLPLAAGLSGMATTHGAAFSTGFSRAMWIGAAFLATASPIAWLTVPGNPPQAKRL